MALLLGALAPLPTARAEQGSVALNLDRYAGTEAVQGWSAGAIWMGRTEKQDPIRFGLGGERIESGRWAFAAAGRTLRIGGRNWCDVSARLGRASLPGQSNDFAEASAVLSTSLIPGRWTLTFGDSWLDVGDREGQLLQGGLEFTAPRRWSAALRLFSGVTGDLDEDYLNGSFRLSASSLTWIVGATRGRTVPFPGAPPGMIQDSTEVYLSVAVPLGRQQAIFADSRLDGESTTRRTLTAAWLFPLPPGKGTEPEGDQP